MKLPKKFIEEISDFETIYCLISGGWHSTTSALLLKDYGFENVILMHNKTFLEMKSSIKTMQLLQEKTQYKYIETLPDLKNESVWDIMRRSFQKIPEVKADIKNGNYNRKKFECCTKLKKKSGDKIFKNLLENSFVVVDSSCPYESDRRRFYATEIKKKNTYLRYIINRKFRKIYPFRDSYNEKPFKEYLLKKGFNKIKHSGCVICPILICFNMFKEERYYGSLKAMARAGLPCFQRTMEDFVK